jgi:hypothetical protein
MDAQRIASAIMITTAMWCAPEFLHGRSPDRHGPAFSAVEVSREHRYRIDARLRPFLFWIRKSNIGNGRLTWRRGPNGTIGYELLVGSDPARTPRHINRWGYLREESDRAGSTVFGVMSQSNEQSVQDADRNTSRTDGIHVFTALQQFVSGTEARVTVSEVRVPKDLTYADLDTLLASVPAAPSKTKTVAVAEWTSSGFLAAAASLIEEERTAVSNAAKLPHLVRVYPYNGELYELQLRSTERVDRHVREGTSVGPAIRGRFRVINRTTHDETPFTLLYGVEGYLTGVPLLISWRPRWWLEIECVLDDDGGR